jgi:hypothetical protein
MAKAASERKNSTQNPEESLIAIFYGSIYRDTLLKLLFSIPVREYYPRSRLNYSAAVSAFLHALEVVSIGAHCVKTHNFSHIKIKLTT